MSVILSDKELTIPEGPFGIRASEAAEMINCSQNHIYSLVNDGHLDSYTISEKGGLRVKLTSIYDFINRGGVKATISSGNGVPAEVRLERNKVAASKSKWG